MDCLHFLDVCACISLLLCYCLGFVYSSSFSIGHYAFFLQLQPSIYPVWDKFYSIFIWLYCCFVPIIQTLYYIVFLSIICPDSICVFLIIAFVYCDIVERVSYSQIVIYSNPCKTVTDGSLLSIRDKLILCRSPKIYNEIFPDQPLSCLKRTGLRLTIRKLGALFIAFEHVVINFKPIIINKS